MNDEVKHPVLKVASVGVAYLGGMTWGEVASMLAAIYTACLITEWLWKRIVKPFAQRRGWVRGRPRDFLDSTGHTDLDDGGAKP